MTKKLSYMLYSGQQQDDTYTMVPGLFQWASAFELFGTGGVLSDDIHKHNLENFDVVHVNYTPGNASYIAAIRENLGENSDTKIIANVDYAVGMWNKMDPFITKEMLSKADMVFHVEPKGADMLTRLLNEKVCTIPHPVNTVEIQKHASEEREPVIMCQYHRYHDTWAEYWWGLREIRKEFPDMMVILMNYVLPKGERGPVPIVSMFDKVVGHMKYFEYLKLLSHATVNIDLAPDFTYGRGVVDAAALGVPTIGNWTIEAMHYIWPNLMFSEYESNDLEWVIKELMKGEKLYNTAVKYGMERCHFYSLENSYNRMVNAVCECC